MRKYSLLIVLPLILATSCGRGDEINPEDVFVKFYGANASLELTDMIFQDANKNGLVLFGTRLGEITDIDEITYIEKNFYLVSVGIDGNIQNEVMLEVDDNAGFVYHFDEEAGRITATSDGGYLIIGTIKKFPGTTELLDYIVWRKLDANLTKIDDWHIVGDDINNYVGVDISEMADGGVLISGYTDANGSNDFYYAKIGGTNPEWTRIQTRAGSDDRLIRALPTENGNYCLFGQTEAFSGDGEMGVNVERTIIDPDGVIQNSLIYGLRNLDANGVNLEAPFVSRNDYPYDVTERPGGFAIVGTSYFSTTVYEPFLLLVDLQGAYKEEKLFVNEFSNNQIINSSASGFGVTQLNNNDYFVLGAIKDFVDPKTGENKGAESFVMKTDQVGNSKGSVQSYGLINGDEKAIRALTDNEGYVFIGATYDFGGGLTQFALLKVNSDGELRK